MSAWLGIYATTCWVTIQLNRISRPVLLRNGKDGCNHLLTEHEVLQVVQIAVETWTNEGELILENRVGNAIQKNIQKLYLVSNTNCLSTIMSYEPHLLLVQAKAHRDANDMQCVNCANQGDGEDSGAWFALPPGNTTAMRVSCPNCQTDFCSQCRTSPCHYRCSCDEVVAYSRAWNDWLQGGQDAFIAVRLLADMSACQVGYHNNI